MNQPSRRVRRVAQAGGGGRRFVEFVSPATKTRARRPLTALVAFAMTLAMTFLPGTAQVAQAQPTDPAATAQASTGNETPTATPCCHRSFLALAQHIAEQHPHYTEERDS